MAAERELIRSAIEELNPQFEKHTKAQLSLIHWKNGVIPGVASEPQAVISAQIQDYDIYIGLMGSRFGSPTAGFGSGTEQEFVEAFKEFEKNPERVWIMFYFRNSSDDLNSLDIDQFAKVRAFKKSLTDKGVLFASYQGSDDFLKQLKQHLDQLMDRWTGKGWKSLTQGGQMIQPIKASFEEVEQKLDSLPDEDDSASPGILDLMSDAQEGIDQSTVAVIAIAATMSAFNLRTLDKANTISHLDVKDPRILKNVINDFAQDMGDVSKELRTLRQVLDARFNAGLSAFEQTVVQMLQLRMLDKEKATEILAKLKELPANIRGAREGMTEVRNALSGLPGFTARFKSRREVFISQLDTLRATLTVSLDKLDSVTGVLDQAIRNLN